MPNFFFAVMKITCLVISFYEEYNNAQQNKMLCRIGIRKYLNITQDFMKGIYTFSC